MNEHKPNHPWRSRSRQFENHMNCLPPAERQRIRAAERQYVAEGDAPWSVNLAVARDFYEITRPWDRPGMHDTAKFDDSSPSY
jgi:hypothetical protein